jgi:hypothetical protein
MQIEDAVVRVSLSSLPLRHRASGTPQGRARPRRRYAVTAWALAVGLNCQVHAAPDPLCGGYRVLAWILLIVVSTIAIIVAALYA